MCAEKSQEVKVAKYFAVLFDSTPDISHTDLFSQILRYFRIQDGSVEVKESFVDFIALDAKRCSVPCWCYFVKDCCQRSGRSRLQGTGLWQCRYNGRETFRCAMAFDSVNHKAQFVPCSNHSLNLAGVHAVSSNSNSVTFFRNSWEIICVLLSINPPIGNFEGLRSKNCQENCWNPLERAT